jgi:DNA invertase Pin-like site-specific DNA recombinase
MEVVYIIIGYARVSTSGQAKKGNSLEDQEKILRQNGCIEIFKESYSGFKMNRPEFKKAIEKLKDGDTLVVTKLDRFARTAGEAIILIRSLVDKGIKVNILNMGLVDIKTSFGRLMLTILSGFAEFERDMIIERTQAGKEIAKQKPGFTEGRPKEYTQSQLNWAVSMLKENSYTQTAKLTGMSKSTLIREMKKQGLTIEKLRGIEEESK